MLKFCIMLHDRLPIAFVEGRVDHLCFNRRNFFFQFLKLASFAAQFFFNGGVRFKVSNLCQICQPNTGGKINVACILLLLANGVE